MSEQTQTIQYIPLNKLIASPRNVRRKHPKAGIESLAASIHSRGLLQNLCVMAGEKDWPEVLKGDNRAIFQAASLASKAAEFVMARSVAVQA